MTEWIEDLNVYRVKYFSVFGEGGYHESLIIAFNVDDALKCATEYYADDNHWICGVWEENHLAPLYSETLKKITLSGFKHILLTYMVD